MWRRIAFVALAGLLVACRGPQAMLRGSGAADPLAPRREALSKEPRWSFDGRVAVSDGKDSGSARVQWEQDGDSYRVTLRVPVSGETWRLSGDASACLLEGARATPARGSDPEELLQRELGWRLPVRALASWARGLSSDARTSAVSLDQEGLPQTLVESGWRIVYRDYRREHQPPMPARIEAERAPYKVRLAISSWGPAADGQ